MEINLPDQARRDLASLPAAVRKEIEKVYRAHPDTKGKGYLEMTNLSPMPGSRKHPWLRKPRQAV